MKNAAESRQGLKNPGQQGWLITALALLSNKFESTLIRTQPMDAVVQEIMNTFVANPNNVQNELAKVKKGKKSAALEKIFPETKLHLGKLDAIVNRDYLPNHVQYQVIYKEDLDSLTHRIRQGIVGKSLSLLVDPYGQICEIKFFELHSTSAKDKKVGEAQMAETEIALENGKIVSVEQKKEKKDYDRPEKNIGIKYIMNQYTDGLVVLSFLTKGYDYQVLEKLLTISDARKSQQIKQIMSDLPPDNFDYLFRE